MKIPHSSTMQRDFSVSMTPMIDVVFLLLIFFVCTASFQITEAILPSPLSLEGSAPVDLPQELTEVDLERILVEVAKPKDQLQLTLNGQVCDTPARLSELLRAVANIDPSLPVILDISGEVPLGTAIDIYDRARLAGFKKIQFAAEAQP